MLDFTLSTPGERHRRAPRAAALQFFFPSGVVAHVRKGGTCVILILILLRKCAKHVPNTAGSVECAWRISRSWPSRPSLSYPHPHLPSPPHPSSFIHSIVQHPSHLFAPRLLHPSASPPTLLCPSATPLALQHLDPVPPAHHCINYGLRETDPANHPHRSQRVVRTVLSRAAAATASSATNNTCCHAILLSP